MAQATGTNAEPGSRLMVTIVVSLSIASGIAQFQVSQKQGWLGGTTRTVLLCQSLHGALPPCNVQAVVKGDLLFVSMQTIAIPIPSMKFD